MENDKFIDFTEAAQLPWLPRRRQGTKLNIATIWRWCHYGIRGIKLRSAKVGGSPVTTEAWMREFFQALASPSEEQTHRTPARRINATDSAMRELSAAGIR